MFAGLAGAVTQLAKTGARGLATITKHYLCWQKSFGGGWWSKSEENRGGSSAVLAIGEAREPRQIRAPSTQFHNHRIGVADLAEALQYRVRADG